MGYLPKHMKVKRHNSNMRAVATAALAGWLDDAASRVDAYPLQQLPRCVQAHVAKPDWRYPGLLR